MLYDANFRFDNSEPRLKPLAFGIVDLIRKNERGELDNGRRLLPIIVRHTDYYNESSFDRHTIMSLPFGGDCCYCLTDNRPTSYACGGFAFFEDALYFASNMINLALDRDGYRQNPTGIKGDYATDSTFIDVINEFKAAEVPLFRATDKLVYYDLKSWPKQRIEGFESMTYDEAFEILDSKKHH